MNYSISYLIQTISENLWELYSQVSSTTGIPLIQKPEFSFVYAPNSPWPNFVFKLSCTLQNNYGAVSELNTLINNKVAPPFLMVDPGVNNSNLAQMLHLNGYKLVMRWPGMIAEPEQFPEYNIHSYSVKKVSTNADLKKWFAIIQTTLFDEKQFQPEYYDLLNNPKLHFYYMEANGRMAGTALVHTNNKTAGFYMVSVLEAHRKKGLAKTMMQEIIDIERKNDIQYFVLQANKQSEKLYSNLGFKSAGYFDIYWKIGLF